jgi:hypothetical protein
MAEWDGAHLSPTRSNDSAFLLRAYDAMRVAPSASVPRQQQMPVR